VYIIRLTSAIHQALVVGMSHEPMYILKNKIKKCVGCNMRLSFLWS